MPRRRNPIGQALGQGLATLGGAYGNRLAQNYEQENQLNLLRNILSEPRRLSVDSTGAGGIDEFGNMQGVQRNVAPIFGPDNALLLAQMNPQFLNILSMAAQEEAKRVPKYDIRGTSPETGFGIFQEEYGQPPKPIDYIPPGRARTDSTEPTQLAKLQNELAAIEKANPNDPRVPQYKQRIQRELEGVQSFIPFSTDQGVVPFQTRKGTFGPPTGVYKATPTEVKQQVASLDDNLKSVTKIREIVGRSDVTGPTTGRARKLGSRFFADKDAQELISLVGQLRTVIYGLSGKQINEAEQNWLETQILPSIIQPDENFEVSLDQFEDWVKRRRGSIAGQFPGLNLGGIPEPTPPDPTQIKATHRFDPATGQIVPIP